jgi:Ca-activated chloride channel family protein
MRNPTTRSAASNFAHVVLVIAATLTSCQKSENTPDTSSRTTPTPTSSEVQLLFTYGSEKEQWISQATASFNLLKAKTASGKGIFVTAQAMGSGECVEQLLAGRQQPHLISPASSVFLKMGEADSMSRTGQALVDGESETLVLSPVVIALWKPMAEALGWPGKALGWADIHALAQDPKGWASHGMPQWGAFRFGHTHPEYSNSGLISILAETYAATGKTKQLTLEDVALPATGQYLQGIEHAVVHYGTSTGFFGKRMFSGGPSYLSAAVLYENMVIDSYREKDLAFPLVSIYPKEGTFWSDHPAAIVNRPWVSAEHKEAARKFIAFLLDNPQQQAALALGFRPGNVSVPTGQPIDAAHGADPNEPKTTLALPDAPVVQAALALWKQHKKRSHVALVLDCSGSMNKEQRMTHARDGALEMLKLLGDEDQISILPFNENATAWATQRSTVGNDRAQGQKQIRGLFANGGTALYDAVLNAHNALTATPDPDKITAIIVLSDGEDQHSRTKLTELLSAVTVSAERPGLRIFTIAYGTGTRKDILEQISAATQARCYTGSTSNISDIFKDISTFF